MRPSIRFSALQRAENSSNEPRDNVRHDRERFQCSSASRKFLKRRSPKRGRVGEEFQCSSASRKFLKTDAQRAVRTSARGFSALQRAENSSNPQRRASRERARRFQCSSASRKFLKLVEPRAAGEDCERFSALQRAENSSNHIFAVRVDVLLSFSALQRAENSSNISASGRARYSARFSALQRAENSSKRFLRHDMTVVSGFSALQRAENSSKTTDSARNPTGFRFQCSSASRKFLKLPAPVLADAPEYHVSVLFSEPKIPQIPDEHCFRIFKRSFSALQRAENSSNRLR